MTTFNKIILIVFLSSVFIGANAQTTVPQIINSSQTWTTAGSPYIVTQNVLVKNGATVNVKPGTIIKSKGNFRIIMEAGAGFEAKGTKDSVILMDSMNFDFSKGAVGYDFTTNTGSVFSYCHFDGTSMLGISKSINFTDISLLVSNCLFTDNYYAIAVNSNSFLRVEKTIFGGKQFNYGYAYYPSGSNNILEMDECVVKHSYGLYLAEESSITRNLFYDILANTGFHVRHTSKSATFKCNTFRKFKSSIIEFGAANPANTEVIVVSNTFDSADYHIDYRVSSTAPYAKFVCKNNNFLHSNKQSVKVGGSSKPGYSDTLVFTKNYWGTTNVAQIQARIWDINDDITIDGLVDYANYQSAMITDCFEDETEESFIGGSASVKGLNNEVFNIYPNPANNFVNISLNNASLKTWKIYNLTGELILTGNLETKENTIDVSNLSSGFYMLEVKDNKTLSGKQKLVINK